MMSMVELECNERPARRGQASSRVPLLALLLLLLNFAIRPAQAQTFTALHDFSDGKDGGIPASTLIRDQAGYLYGTTWQGGANCNPPQGCGTVFRVSPRSKETVLYDFKDKPDDVYPYAGLIRDRAGNLYGTTLLGGTSNVGTIFKLDASGKEAVLYSFTGGKDGGNPLGTLIRDANGNLFGTTNAGGDLSCRVEKMSGCGVVFKLAKNGKYTVLHRFHGIDGADPNAGLIRDDAGNLYGTTFAGGSMGCYGNWGCGTVFKVDQAGKETVVYAFTLGTDGGFPKGGLIRDAAGNLYGTTTWGGDLACNSGNVGCGTVFKLDENGKETVLYKFTSGADGGLPGGSLVRDAGGNLYGTTSVGGDLSCNNGGGCGTVFKLDKSRAETVLHDFEDQSDGAFPEGGLVRDASGTLYGTTPGNVTSTWGSVFKLVP